MWLPNLSQFDPAPVNRPVPQVTLWTLFFDDCRDQSGLLGSYRALLSPDEIARMERFVFERDRFRHLLARSLVRVVLGGLLGVDPASLRFDTGPQGKPKLAEGMREGLSFNLTHTRDMAVLAVADAGEGGGVDLGVDAESTDRAAPLEVGLRQFAPVEVGQLRALRVPTRHGDGSDDQEAIDPRLADHCWSLWTLKESLIKATGLGLSTPLDRFGFELDSGSRGIRLHSQPGTEEARQAWWFGTWRPSGRHMAALCVARPSPASPRPIVKVRRTVPLRDDIHDSGAEAPAAFILHTPEGE